YPKTHYPVEVYDGSHIPFPDNHFDIVFSSNVLEHVRDVPTMLRETRRVLKNDGVAIHVLPSSSWRFWTLITHYPDLALRVFRKLGGQAPQPTASDNHGSCPRTWSDKLKDAVVPPPHGEYATSLSELYYYSAHRWKKMFRTHGFHVLQVEP